MSFECPHCHFKNTEVQPAGEIQQRGSKFTLKVETADDLSRQIVKSDTAVFRIEDIDLEIPPGRGQLSNVEGILSMVAQDLEQKQEERKEVMPEVYAKIQGVIETIKQMASGAKLPFKLTVDDPAGNSSIEPPSVLSAGKYSRNEYPRTAAQNEALGLGDTSGEAPATEMRPEYHASQMYPEMPSGPMVNNVDEDIIENQVYSFPATCPGCTNSCTTNMKMVNIPHFKQVVLMSTVCDHCGCKSSMLLLKYSITDTIQTEVTKSRLEVRCQRRAVESQYPSITRRISRATFSRPSLAPCRAQSSTSASSLAHLVAGLPQWRVS
jgi:zinc finger protein